MRCAANSLLLLLAGAPAAACEPPALAGATRIEGKQHVVLVRSEPATTPLNIGFSVEIAACARSGGSVAAPRIDAWMPAHRHGMNYRPSVTSTAPGIFRADGLLLHMPGRWEFAIEIGGERLTQVRDIE
jgi:hypothetical protein